MAPDRGSVTKLNIPFWYQPIQTGTSVPATFKESSGIPPMPFSFVPCSDVETGEDLWSFNDFQNRKIHIMPSWQIQSFMDKRYGIVHENRYKLMD